MVYILGILISFVLCAHICVLELQYLCVFLRLIPSCS